MAKKSTVTPSAPLAGFSINSVTVTKSHRVGEVESSATATAQLSAFTKTDAKSLSEITAALLAATNL